VAHRPRVIVWATSVGLSDERLGWSVLKLRLLRKRLYDDCAEAIIKKPPKQFVVPVYAAQCAARAIRQRKKSSQWHESQVDGLNGIERVAKEEGIAGHGFFT